MEQQENFQERLGLTTLQTNIQVLKEEMSKVIVGQESMINNLILALLTNGHVLLEGVPGIAKTLTIKILARMFSADYSRIQFTPDLMPSDVTGTSVFNASTADFEFKAGPVFSNLVLIDEINRAPAKTQSALFEVMEERQVTIDGITHTMKAPFLVFATQNPLEHEGTYRLPEAQLDRFLFKIKIDYPSQDEEFMILSKSLDRKGEDELKAIKAVLKAKQLIEFQKQVKQVLVEENLMKYIAALIHRTRNHPALFLGASPRASVNILSASQAQAAVNGRDFVIPEDVRAVLVPVLNHRIYMTPEKELEGATEELIIQDIINAVEVPR